MRGEERVEEEQRRSRELMQRLERERQLEVQTLINLIVLGDADDGDADFLRP